MYSRSVSEDDIVFVGGDSDDPAFAVLSPALEMPRSSPVHEYARPLSAEQVDDYHAKLDAVEPAHASAAARLTPSSPANGADRAA
jgi:hypothetical protein